jgi:hypothetical protein
MMTSCRRLRLPTRSPRRRPSRRAHPARRTAPPRARRRRRRRDAVDLHPQLLFRPGPAAGARRRAALRRAAAAPAGAPLRLSHKPCRRLPPPRFACRLSRLIPTDPAPRAAPLHPCKSRACAVTDASLPCSCWCAPAGAHSSPCWDGMGWNNALVTQVTEMRGQAGQDRCLARRQQRGAGGCRCCLPQRPRARGGRAPWTCSFRAHGAGAGAAQGLRPRPCCLSAAAAAEAHWTSQHSGPPQNGSSQGTETAITTT